MNHSISTMTGKTKIKIVFLGSQSVGKSSIIEKYIHDRFEQTANPTVGIDFLAKNISHKTKNYRLQLWDTAGQQRFRSLIPSYLKDANCALIVFDITSKNTLAEAQMWASLFNENKGGEGYIFLIGNKLDLDYREVSKEEGIQKAKKLNVPYFEISAKTGDNIQDLFLKLIQSHGEKGILPSSLTVLDKKQIIKQQAKEEEQQNNKVGVDDTGNKIATNNEVVNQSIQQKNQQKENVVLKNQDVSNNKNRKKSGGCC